MFVLVCFLYCFFFFKQKTAYEMRISDWSSDVCSSDLVLNRNYLSGIFLTETERPNFLFIPAKGEPAAFIPGLDRDMAASWRSEERRVGKECVSTCRSRWSPYH